MQKTEAELTAALEAARAAYHTAHETETVAQLHARSQEIKGLMQSLNDLLSAGANPCPACGVLPHGCCKTPATVRGKTIAAPIYEVGCLGCPPLEEETDLGTRVTERRAQSYSPETAVLLWNAGQYLPGTVRPAATPLPALPAGE
jgi:hypothetical protein